MYYAFVAKCLREKEKKAFAWPLYFHAFISHMSKEYFLDFYIWIF